MLSAMEDSGERGRGGGGREGARPEREPGATGEGAAVVRLRPLRVAIVSADERFRAVTSMLVARRGCATSSFATAEPLGEQLAGGHVDVVLVDGLVSLRAVADEVLRVAPLAAPVGLVLAAEDDERVPAELVTVDKWSPFERVFDAILQADRRRTRPCVADRSRGLSLIAAERLG